MWGTLAGSMLPFILRRLGFDPASASAPFVATLVDVSGLVIYFTAAAASWGGRCSDGPTAARWSRAVAAWLVVRSSRAATTSRPSPSRRTPSRSTRARDTGCPPLPPISGFVGRGDAALLLDSVTPFRATGTNLYYLQQLLSYAQQDQDPTALQAVRRGAGRSGLPVAAGGAHLGLQRFEGHVVDPAQPARRASARRGCAGSTRRSGRPSGAASGVILPLVNNWGEYGGLPAYAAWASAAFGGKLRARRLLHERADEAVVEGLRATRSPTASTRSPASPTATSRRSWPGRSATSCAARAAPGRPSCPTRSPSWRRS